MPLASPSAMAAMTPVPVMPTALPCIVPSLRDAPVLGINGVSILGQYTVIEDGALPVKLGVHIADGAGEASMPALIDCPSMAGPAAADPV